MKQSDDNGTCRKTENETVCRKCGELKDPDYWCDVCEREVAEKRCPYCGLKARKIREIEERR